MDKVSGRTPLITVSGRTPRQRTIRISDSLAGISLRQVRKWYSDDGGDGSGDEPPPEGTGADAPPPQPEEGEEVRQLKAEIQEKEDRIRRLTGEAARERKAKKSALEDTGNWERLAKDFEVENLRLQTELDALKPYKERVDALIRETEARNERRIAQIPKINQSLVPDFATPEQTSAFLDTNWNLLTASTAPDIDAGAGGGGGGKPPPKSIASDRDRMAAEIAKSHGIKIEPEAIAKRRAIVESRRNQSE